MGLRGAFTNSLDSGYDRWSMAGLPAVLCVRERGCLIVGGGGVALRRARALIEAGAAVTVVAPRVDDALAKLDVTLRRRPFEPEDLDGMFLVVAATDSPAVNAQVAAEAASRRVLVNRTDDPEAGDVNIPAHTRRGPITVAVDTGGISAAAAAAIRDELLQHVDADWPRLLERAAPYRERITATFTDAAERRARLVALTSPAAMRTWKGGAAAFDAYCARLLDPAARLCDQEEVTNA
jgi:siroheme synthase-like protein